MPEFVRRDFTDEISRNKFKSSLLILAFPAIIIGLIWGITGYFGYPTEIMIFAAAIAMGYVVFAYFSGDRMILGISGARKADKALDYQLINIVDEMRIAGGIPMPDVYIIDTTAANAFATGRNPNRAAVAVTSGLKELLNREELQGVIAHEISHVRNYDIRFMMLVAALVGVIALIADALRHYLWWGGMSSRRSRGSSRVSGGHPLMAIIAVMLILLAPLFSMLLQMAISRKREYLADASAVELTRNPLALASALEKLDSPSVKVPFRAANRATQHLFITNPLKVYSKRSKALLSTHPPIEERVRMLRSMA